MRSLTDPSKAFRFFTMVLLLVISAGCSPELVTPPPATLVEPSPSLAATNTSTTTAAPSPTLFSTVTPTPLPTIPPTAKNIQGVQAWDRFAYCNNNPVRWNDPSGHWIESFLDIASIAYDIFDISQNGLNWGTGFVLVADIGSLILPGVTGGGLAVRALTHADEAVAAVQAVNTVGNITQAANQADNLTDVLTHVDDLPNNALVCRGGSCVADRFTSGSGVVTNADGTLSGVSVNSASGASFEELTSVGIPHSQVGVTTVGDVRAAGGIVTPSHTINNPYHATLSGITPYQAQNLFTPTRPNPHFRGGR